MKNKLTMPKGFSIEGKFENGMTLELWYNNIHHTFDSAEKVFSDVVKSYNMHDDLISILKECHTEIRVNECHKKSIGPTDLDKIIEQGSLLDRIKQIIKKSENETI